jgi:hypothetical protein
MQQQHATASDGIFQDLAPEAVAAKIFAGADDTSRQAHAESFAKDIQEVGSVPSNGSTSA